MVKIGKIFGKWTVLEECGVKDKSKLWNCRCSCGYEKAFTTSYLNTGKATCCLECREKYKREVEINIINKYLNKKIGDFTVIKYLGKNRYNSRKWLCRCKCGYERIFGTSYLSGSGLRKATQCKKCYKEELELKNRVTDYIPNRFWYRFLNSAERRKIEIDVTKKYIFEIYENQEKKCALTGMDLYFTEFRTNYNRYTNASLDRIDSSKGYIKGNIQWVCKKINLMKQRYSQEEFIEMCKLVAKNFNQ